MCALTRALALTPAAAEAVPHRPFRRDDERVCDAPPKSLCATSWTTHTPLGRLAMRARKQRAAGGGDGAPAVAIGRGGWVFEPQATVGKSNDSRARWILLALACDLDERVYDLALDHHALLPRRLVASAVGYGRDAEPGPGRDYTAGATESRFAPFPVASYATLAECEDGEDDDDARIRRTMTPRPARCDTAAAAASAVLSDGGETRPRDDGAGRLNAASAVRVSAIVDAIAPALEVWAWHEPINRIGQLTLTASEMVSRVAVGALRAAFARATAAPAPPAAATAPTTPTDGRPPRGGPCGSGADGWHVGAADVCAAALKEPPPEIQAEVRA